MPVGSYKRETTAKQTFARFTGSLAGKGIVAPSVESPANFIDWRRRFGENGGFVESP